MRVWIPALAFALAIIATGCGRSETGGGAPPSSPASPSSAAPSAAAPEAPSAPTPPAPAAGSPTPAPAPAAAQRPADPARGKPLYATYCASCHGVHGDGDGPVAASLNPKPARHSDGQYMDGLSNAHLFQVIKNGGASVGKSPLMAPWGGTLDDAQIRDVIAYVRTLAKPPYEGPPP
jgi:mono/diheme cytochrome c family protein